MSTPARTIVHEMPMSSRKKERKPLKKHIMTYHQTGLVVVVACLARVS